MVTEGVVETYTWAGHTRVRATSLVEGGLRGPGFVEITNSTEDQILDIEGYNDDEANQEFSSDGTASQYTGKSFSELIILASTNPQYDKRLFIELQLQAQNMLCT